MAYSEKKYKQKITLGQSGNALMTLIAICLVMFVGMAFMKAIWHFRYTENPEHAVSLFNKNVLGWFVMPADFNAFLQKPWTLLTHMFVHNDIWIIIANMLWLWCFGYIMQDMTGNRKIVPVFIYGALGGAIAFMLVYNFMPSLKPLAGSATAIGASAGVMAVAMATTLVSPGYRIFPMLNGGIPLWVLTIVYLIADLAILSISDTGNLVSHLAGALTGFLFIWFLRQGYDGSEWMNQFFDWVNNLFDPDKPKKGSKSVKDELFYKTPDSGPYKKIPKVTQQRVDEILDKISQQGYHYLTDEEKDLLKRAGETDL